jgi:hypothetical protein
MQPINPILRNIFQSTCPQIPRSQALRWREPLSACARGDHNGAHQNLWITPSTSELQVEQFLTLVVSRGNDNCGRICKKSVDNCVGCALGCGF